MENKKYRLAASLICSNMMRLEDDIRLLMKGGIDFIHFDVMDGIFVQRYGLFPEILTQMRKFCSIPADFHMMVEDVEPYIKTFVDAGANQDDIFVVHAESTRHLHRSVRKIREQGLKAGVALNPATSPEVLRYVLPDIDLIMLMAINPGVVGHKLIPQMMGKIADTRKMIAGRDNIIIEIDGGVNFESAPQMIAHGASMLVCGSQTIYRPQEAPIDQKIRELRQVLDKS